MQQSVSTELKRKKSNPQVSMNLAATDTLAETLPVMRVEDAGISSNN